MEEKAQSYLSKLSNDLRTNGDADTATTVDECLAAFNRRHWHEMSVALLKVITAPAVLEQAYALHDSVLTTIRADISPIVYVKLVQAVCFSPASTLEKALAIIEGAQACFVGQDATQGRYAAQCIRAMLLLQSGDDDSNVVSSLSRSAYGLRAGSQAVAVRAQVPGTGPHTARKILEEVEAYTQSLQMHEVEPVLLAVLCRARGRDYELRNQYTRYYTNAFDVVTYAAKSEMAIAPGEMGDLAFTTAVAALLSEEIFNFGKFLNFKPFVTALERSGGRGSSADSNHAWVLEWMRMCNEGDVNAFEDFATEHRSVMERQAPMLNVSADHLGKKVRLMGLLHLVFYTPFDDRTFTFSAIAARCCVSEDQTEPVLLAALAQGIVRGKIDGLLRQVHISWVEPRVLSLLEVKELAVHVASWRQNVVGVADYVSSQTKLIS